MAATAIEECDLKPIIGLVAALAVVVGGAIIFISLSGDEATELESTTEPRSITTTPTAITPTTTPTTTITTTTTIVAAAPPPSTLPDEPVPSGSTDCLVGNWLLDSDAFLDAVFEAAAPDVQTQATFEYGGGTYTLGIRSDLTYDSVRIDWEMIFITDEGTVFSTFNGGQSGTLVVEGDNIMWDEESAAVTIKLEVEIAGVRQELPIGGEQAVNTQAIEGTGTFSCTGDLLTATNEGITTIWNRQSAGG